jgi:hypothetical protein
MQIRDKLAEFSLSFELKIAVELELIKKNLLFGGQSYREVLFGEEK